MINITLFTQLFEKLSDNFDFGLDPNKKSDINYLPTLFDFLEYQKVQISDNDLKSAIYEIMSKMTKEDWNKKFGYGGKPAVADWLSFLGSKIITPDQMAILELSIVKNIAKKLTTEQAFLFENGTTNAVIEELGGLRKIQMIILSDVDISFFNNEFRKTWIAFFMGKKESKLISGYTKFFFKERKSTIEFGLCDSCYNYNCIYDHLEKDNPVTIIQDQFAKGRTYENSLSLSNEPIGKLVEIFSAEKTHSISY